MDPKRKQIKLAAGCLGFLLFTFNSSFSLAQSTTSASEIKRDTVVTETHGKYPVVTNPFWDNWFIGGGAGGQIYYGDHNKRQDSFGKRISPAFEFYVGKWFSPGLGIRAGIGGFQVKGLTQNGSHSNGVDFDPTVWLTEQEFSYYHAHADALFNIHNIFQGFKEDRFYNMVPYVGLGWLQTSDEPKAREVSANLGLLNTFRLGASLDLTLDIRGAMFNDRFDGETGGRKEEGTLSALLGIAYKFDQRGWNKPTTTVISYDEAVLNGLRNRVNALEKDNDGLRAQLAAAKDKSITDIQVQNRILAAPILVTFPINKAIVSNEARVNLGFFAKVIKEGNAKVVYKVTGYADKGTGTPEINSRLSQARAEAIRDVLVNEFDVPASQIEVDYKGGVENMYYDDPRLSRAVITIAK